MISCVIPELRSSGVADIEMAEKDTSSSHSPSQTLSDQKRSKTRVNIGAAFPLSSKLKDKRGLKSSAMVTTILVDR